MYQIKLVGSITDIGSEKGLGSILSLSNKKYYFRHDRFTGKLEVGDTVFFEVDLRGDNRLVLGIEKYRL